MSDTAPTPDEILTLIRATHSDNRPNPEEPQKEVQTQWTRFFLSEHSVVVLEILQLPILKEWYEWEQGRLELIEEYVTEERLEALADGAEPTEEERACFDERARQNDIDNSPYFCECADVLRLSAPAGSGEERVVYFCWIGYKLWQAHEVSRCAGPLRDMTEVESALGDAAFGPMEVDGRDEFAEYAERLRERASAFSATDHEVQ